MRQVDFEHGSVGRNMIQSALPMLVAQLFALLYNIVDRIFLGRIPGEGTMALAGVGLCFPLVILTIGFANLFGTGGAPLFSIALGAKDRESAKHIQTTAFLLLSGAALVIMAVGLIFSRPFLKYLYAMVPYIIKDEPDLSAKEVLQRSKEMMRGHKWHTFILDLSFLGWIILAVLTLGVLSFFWVDPYIKSTDAALYSVLKGER